MGTVDYSALLKISIHFFNKANNLNIFGRGPIDDVIYQTLKLRAV